MLHRKISSFLAATALCAALAIAPSFTQQGATAMAAEVSVQSLKVGKDTLAYLEAGSGPALVIVHGVGGHKEDWRAVVEAFAATHHVFAIDMMGFGGSSRDAADLSMGGQAHAIKALLDAKNINKTDLIGNSVGGWAAATFASSYPDRTNRLVVVDPAGFEAMFKGEPPVNIFPDDVAQMKKLLEFVIYSDFAHTDDFAAKAYAGFVASGEKTLVPRLNPALFGSPKLEEIMPKITAPTLVIWGREDKLFPVALADHIASLTKGAQVHIIDKASHFPQVDQPKVFVEVASGFLK